MFRTYWASLLDNPVVVGQPHTSTHSFTEHVYWPLIITVSKSKQKCTISQSWPVLLTSYLHTYHHWPCVSTINHHSEQIKTKTYHFSKLACPSFKYESLKLVQGQISQITNQHGYIQGLLTTPFPEESVDKQVLEPIRIRQYAPCQTLQILIAGTHCLIHTIAPSLNK